VYIESSILDSQESKVVHIEVATTSFSATQCWIPVIPVLVIVGAILVQLSLTIPDKLVNNTLKTNPVDSVVELTNIDHNL